MILGVESSCDDSALALFDPERGIRGEWVSSQISLHEKYGGVVPELASREHLRNLPLLLGEALRLIGPSAPERIAYTLGPGLAPCLAMGKAAAQALALHWGCPVFGVNHLRAHAFSPFLSVFEENPLSFERNWTDFLPHLGLLVSGGNTLLFLVHGVGSVEILAETRDDAAGEALDKGAKLLGLPYPGGPQIEALAKRGNRKKHHFPRGQSRKGELFFSFSGLKTSLRYHLETLSEEALEASLADLCASYQEAVVESLERKTEVVLRSRKDIRSLGLSGGVAQNKRLLGAWQNLGERYDIPVLPTPARHCGDNASMIAFAAWLEKDFLPECPAIHPSLRLSGFSRMEGV